MIGKEDMTPEQSGHNHAGLDRLALKPKHLGVGVDSHWRDGSFEVTRHGLTHMVRSATFAEYARMISMYSQRSMSYEHDAINALAGLLRIFSFAFQSPFVYGLPSGLLDIALIWRPLEPLRRRDSSLGFPSWSWAGWKGKVAYSPLVKMRRDETGQSIETEGIRPMLRYFVVDVMTGSLQPLNGTGRGIPLADDELPAEWEAHAPRDKCWSATHSCEMPDLFHLDPRIIPELSDRHLVFYASTLSDFQLVDQHVGPSNEGAERLVLENSACAPMGVAVLDTWGTVQSFEKAHDRELIVISECHESLFNGQSDLDEYSCYLVMLAETDSATGVTKRLSTLR